MKNYWHWQVTRLCWLLNVGNVGTTSAQMSKSENENIQLPDKAAEKTSIAFSNKMLFAEL